MFRISAGKFAAVQMFLVIVACSVGTPGMQGDDARIILVSKFILPVALSAGFLAVAFYELLEEVCGLLVTARSAIWAGGASLGGALVATAILRFIPESLFAIEALDPDLIPGGLIRLYSAGAGAMIAGVLLHVFLLAFVSFWIRRDVALLLVPLAALISEAVEVGIFVCFGGISGSGEVWPIISLWLAMKMPGILIMLPWSVVFVWTLSAVLSLQRKSSGSDRRSSGGPKSLFAKCRNALCSALRSLKTAYNEGEGFDAWFRR